MSLDSIAPKVVQPIRLNFQTEKFFEIYLNGITSSLFISPLSKNKLLKSTAVKAIFSRLASLQNLQKDIQFKKKTLVE